MMDYNTNMYDDSIESLPKGRRPSGECIKTYMINDVVYLHGPSYDKPFLKDAYGAMSSVYWVLADNVQ